MSEIKLGLVSFNKDDNVIKNQIKFPCRDFWLKYIVTGFLKKMNFKLKRYKAGDYIY